MKLTLPPVLGFDPVACGGFLATLSGAASIAWPYFDGMTAALVAVAFLGWITRMGRDRSRTRPAVSTGVAVLVLALVALGWAAYLVAPGALWGVRGAALGAPGLAIAFTGGRPPAFGEAG